MYQVVSFAVGTCRWLAGVYELFLVLIYLFFLRGSDFNGGFSSHLRVYIFSHICEGDACILLVDSLLYREQDHRNKRLIIKYVLTFNLGLGFMDG